MGTTEEMTETTAPPPARPAPPASAPPEIQRLPTLALTSAGRALRVVAIVTLLAVLLGAAAAMRADRAGDPLPPRSADERAYLTLARDLALNGNYGGPGTEMDDPLHWPPGAPALFATARLVAGGDEGELAPGSLYSAQAVVGSLAVLGAFAAAALLAGPWAGLAAAAATAFYPPLVDATGRALSEPLGALALVLALVACVWAARRPRWWRFGLAGLALGGTLLVRADLAPALPLIAIWALLVGRRSAGWRGGALTAGALLAGTLIAVAPWVIHASQRADRLIPISTSGGSAIFVGTYLPGDGTMFGLKRALGNQMRLQNPRLGATPNFRLPQERLLDLVAARHPEMGRDEALRAEAGKNVDRYALGQPFAFAGMMVEKAARMWTTPNRGPHGQLTALGMTTHLLLVGLALLGTILGVTLARGRPGLGAIVAVAIASTAINAIFLSEPRHLLPLLPALFATGAAGWAFVIRRHVAQQRA